MGLGAHILSRTGLPRRYLHGREKNLRYPQDSGPLAHSVGASSPHWLHRVIHSPVCALACDDSTLGSSEASTVFPSLNDDAGSHAIHKGDGNSEGSAE